MFWSSTTSPFRRNYEAIKAPRPPASRNFQRLVMGPFLKKGFLSLQTTHNISHGPHRLWPLLRNNFDISEMSHHNVSYSYFLPMRSLKPDEKDQWFGIPIQVPIIQKWVISKQCKKRGLHKEERWDRKVTQTFLVASSQVLRLAEKRRWEVRSDLDETRNDENHIHQICYLNRVISITFSPSLYNLSDAASSTCDQT